MRNRSAMRRLVAICGVVAAVCIISIVVAGLTSLVSLAERIHPLAGQIVFWLALAAIAVGVLWSLFAYSRMPAALVAPDVNAPDYEEFVDALRARLRANPLTGGRSLATIVEIESALADLSVESDAVVRNTASTVFLSTALMQNGRLDGMIVLFTQIRMVWRIARIYVQRPSPREMIQLYANVAGTAFVASGLESLDIGEMFAPLATSIVPALKGGIPGLSGISHLLVRCVSTGAANAFLTLRVGEVARRYCELTSKPSAELIRKSATAAAVHHLGRIVRENGMLVSRKIWESTGGALVEGGLAKAEDVRDAARGWFDRISSWRSREEALARE
ncbi:MAG: DUF697 domain-containing protein [Chthoniobacterales bacterium]